MEMFREFVGDTRRAVETRTASHTGSRTPHEGEVKLVKLSDQDDIEAYLTTFERVMRAYEVKEERWAVKLAPQLTGKAQLAYAAMSTEQAGDYEALKEAILRRYDISEETYRQRFRAAVKKEDEVVSELAVRLNDLLQKWTKTCTSADEVRDRVVQEQLLNSLPMDVRIWVSEHRPKTAAEAAERADNYLRARKQERTSGVVGDPRRERKPWHGKADAEGRGDRGTIPKAPWQDEGKRKETAQEAGKERSGHRKEGSFSGVHCYNCGKRGHISRNCPSNVLCCVGWKEGLRRAGLVNGHKVSDIMLDTGCSRTMVHGDLVSREQLIEGKATAIRCAHGDTVLYPMAEVEMEVDGCTIHTLAAVCNTLPMDVLLGTDVAELDCLLERWRTSLGRTCWCWR